MSRKKVSGFSSQAQATAIRTGSWSFRNLSRPALAMSCFTSSSRGLGSYATQRDKVAISVGIFPSVLITRSPPLAAREPVRARASLFWFLAAFLTADFLTGLRFVALMPAPPRGAARRLASSAPRPPERRTRAQAHPEQHRRGGRYAPPRSPPSHGRISPSRDRDVARRPGVAPD